MNREERLKADEYYPGIAYQPLFDHMIEEHGLTLLQGEMDEIIRIVKGAESEEESNQSGIETIRKRISFLENSGSKSKAAENLLFKELDTLKWVLKSLNQQ